MKTILGYILTPFFHLYMALLIAVFYPIQVIALHIFGEKTRMKSVDSLNYGMVKGLYLLGANVKFSGFEKVPENRPLIVVSNHQSMYDIPAIGWGFKKYSPKFIAKKELSKNMLSISYNLKHGKSALIDRTNGSQAVREIFRLGRLIEQNNYAACIFPEGTRSKTGKPRPFKSAGIQTLLRAAPSAIVVPFVIKGHNNLMKKGLFPLQIGEKISYSVLQPIEPKDFLVEELTAHLQNIITESLYDEEE